jgi:Ni/Fe-hydrogenase subunit HybB-like protein
MPWLTLEEIDYDVFQALKAPRVRFYLILSILLLFIIAGAIAFVYQVKTGMGVTGLNHPVMWGTYLGNFIFFIGIAHSGTFISAILYLLRARFRDEISRSSEAMTVIMISIALSYPLIHLGRIWMFYYVLPYPSQREIWPNFISPFLWDLFAITTYLIVSTIFFYVGLIPDLAAARDQFTTTHGPKHPRTRLYRALSLGWMGSASQWQHDTRAYLYFAVLATPLVISVHTVVSFDFSMANLPGWHITLYAPYFVTGAIHSGLAMVLTLMIPMRSILPIGHIIQPRHFNKVAQVMLVTGSLLAYFYLMENFSGWYSQEVYENQFVFWRATGPYAWMFWTLIPLIIIAPMTFISNRLRNNLSWLFIISILVNIGMWTERYLIVAAATSHGFLPHAWGFYIISLV